MTANFDLVGIGMTSQRTRNRLVERLREKGISNESVLAAIGAVPRHIFIDEALAHRAYEDTALPIGQGQTISQPFVVALMSEVLLVKPRQRVLEVGTGSGYQTAILSTLLSQPGAGAGTGKLFTIERHAALTQRARVRLEAMRCVNIRYRHGDGYQGWAGEGPFDGILVTAAPPSVPEALLAQLAPGGRLVVPIGGEGSQELRVYDHTADGIVSDTLEKVRFVPLVQGPVIGRNGAS